MSGRIYKELYPDAIVVPPLSSLAANRAGYSAVNQDESKI